MKVTVKPTEKPEKLLEYLKPRVEKAEKGQKDEIKVEMEKTEKLGRIPGVEKYTIEDQEKDGLGGKPIHRKAFFEIKNREDAAKAFLATVDGYTLYISTERDWDLRVLKKYNSEIVEAEREVAEKLGADKLDMEFDLNTQQLLAIYDEFLTE